MQAIHVKNPHVLMVPEMQGLIQRATTSVHFAAPGGFDSIATDMYKFITADGLFMVVGMENGKHVGMVLGGFPSLAIFPYPTIFLFYNEGTPGMVKTLAKKTLDILMEHGYTKAWAVNSSHASDAVWSRLFRIQGVTELLPMGTVFELRIK